MARCNICREDDVDLREHLRVMHPALLHRLELLAWQQIESEMFDETSATTLHLGEGVYFYLVDRTDESDD